jgi:hypothetical protein
MASEEQDAREEQEGQQGGGGGATALKVAAAAAATGAAAYAARKAVTRNGGSNGHGSERSSSKDSGLAGSIFSGSWDAARDQLLPLAEDAAGAAGKFVAENGPEIVCDRLLPRFISSFENARDD